MKDKKLKWLFTGVLSLFNFNTFSTPITDRIKPMIEKDDKKAFENDMKILRKDVERAMYEFQQEIKTIKY